MGRGILLVAVGRADPGDHPAVVVLRPLSRLTQRRISARSGSVVTRRSLIFCLTVTACANRALFR